MSIYQATSPNPVVLLSSVSVNLSPGSIAELAGMGQQAEDLALEPTINADNAIIIGSDDEWFQPRPSTSRRVPAGGKNMKAMLKSLRSPSPTPSYASTQSVPDNDSDEDVSKMFEEERQRRAEWCRLLAGKREAKEAKRTKARELVYQLNGDLKSLKNQREALRVQLRALDDREDVLYKRRRLALHKLKQYDLDVAKYDEMNI